MKRRRQEATPVSTEGTVLSIRLSGEHFQKLVDLAAHYRCRRADVLRGLLNAEYAKVKPKRVALDEKKGSRAPAEWGID